jgi:hypothetical protein
MTKPTEETPYEPSPGYKAFVAEVKAKVAPYKTLAEWVAAHPGEHLWADYKGMQCCAPCGVCKRGDGKPQKPCRGIVKLELR